MTSQPCCPEAAWFRVPGGMFLPVLGVLICLALLNWWLVRNRPAVAAPEVN